MAPVVEALVTLVGGGQTTPPGGTHEVDTQEEADQLVARGFARWPKEAPRAEAAEETKTEDAAESEPEPNVAIASEESVVESTDGEEGGDDAFEEEEEEDERQGGEVADGEILFASAAAKKLAEAEGLAPEDFDGVAPSKPNGYTKADVESVAALKRAKEIAGGAADEEEA
jgi:hypothetical protein